MRGSSVLVLVAGAVACHVMWWLQPWPVGVEWVSGFGAGCAFFAVLTWVRDRGRAAERDFELESALVRAEIARSQQSLLRRAWVEKDAEVRSLRGDLTEMGQANQLLRAEVGAAREAAARGRGLTTHLE